MITYDQWDADLGTPPYIQQEMWPLYKAMVAAGDPGKLTPTGFVLFEDYNHHLAQQVEAVWTAFQKVETVFSKKAKPQSEISAPPGGAESYWLHPGNMRPDHSAEDAPARKAPVIDWLKGPIWPPRNLETLDDKFAPPYVLSRIKYGNYGSFDVARMLRDSFRP